jgi:hypothetical protein
MVNQRQAFLEAEDDPVPTFFFIKKPKNETKK